MNSELDKLIDLEMLQAMLEYKPAPGYATLPDEGLLVLVRELRASRKVVGAARRWLQTQIDETHIGDFGSVGCPICALRAALAALDEGP